jgi:hypothetical protein
MSTDVGEYNKELATELGELIRKLNPYTNKQNKDAGQSTGEMELYVNGTRQSFLPTGSNTNIGLEMEGPYRQEWTFKGQPQKVGMAARIKYRYPVQNGKEVLFWVEDYLLIGFQGSMGG